MWEWIVNNISWLSTLLFALISGLIIVIGAFKKDSPVVKGLKVLLGVVKQFPEYIKQAEKVSDDPEEKKAFALKQAVLNCQAQGVTPTEEQIVEMSMQIDEQVALTKSINLQSKTTTENTMQTKQISKI